MTTTVNKIQLIHIKCPILCGNVKNHPVAIKIVICRQYIDFPISKKFKGENQNNISIFYLCHAVGCLKIAVALRSSLESICLTHEIS